MKISGDAKSLALLVGVGALAFVGVAWFLKRQVKDAASAVANVNQGTPYANSGVVGTVGHGFDAASGGVFSDVGSWLGGKLYDLTHPEDSSSAVATAESGPPDLITRKQAVSDGFWGGFTEIFTPSSP